MRTNATRSLSLLWLCLLLACHRSSSTVVPLTTEWSTPERVYLRGYVGDAMEPFLTRDGKILFFNNLNEPQVNTNLHWAERIDDTHFRYRGELQGINTAALEGVASMDRDGNLFFVSNRSYEKTASTLYRGRFSVGSIASIELVPGVSLAKPGIVNFDAEISADGNTLYFVESQFGFNRQPKTAILLFARRVGNRFVRAPESAAILASINAKGLNYAPAASASELEIFFTRLDGGGPAIYTAHRSATTSPFGEPMKIAAIGGFVEGPTLSPDGKSLYYHRRDGARFDLYRVTRR